MSLGAGMLGLARPFSAASDVPPPDTGTTTPPAIPGLLGWWDASTFADLMASDAVPVTDCLTPVARIRNKVAGGTDLLPYSHAGAGTLPTANGHLSGLLSGIGRIATSPGTLAPCLDPDLGFTVSNVGVRPEMPWTLYLVWSRPNLRQGSGQDSAPITLISWNGLPLLQADSSASSRRLVLFPGTSPITLTTDLSRRHTHSIVLRSVPVTGVDVWLDDERVVTNAVNPLSTGTDSPLLLLHDGTAMGAAQCWFHEAAAWSSAISDTDVASLLQHASRWRRGARKGLYLIFNGQSNAINYTVTDGAAALLAQGIAWYLGALACNILATTGGPGSYTMQSGHGLYPAVEGTYPGSFVSDPQDGTPANLWPFGQDGQAVAAAIQSLPVEDRNDICAFVWPWNETDSLRTSDEQTTFSLAAGRFLELERALIDKPPAQLPLVWWSAIPYGTDAGMAMHKRAVASLAADAARNVVIGNPQTADSNPRGAVWDEVTGTTTGGDPAHRDGDDNRRFARLAAPVVARALMSAGYGDSLSSLPDGIPHFGGPRIVYAYRQSDTQIVVTVQHDAGDDLIVPRQAAAGKGFAITDGDVVSGTGRVVPATACSRLNDTQLLLTLSAPLQHGSAACALHYPYGGTSIGRGNAVTDNHASRIRMAGWEIEAHLGAAWSLDFPLASTLLPVGLADTPY